MDPSIIILSIAIGLGFFVQTNVGFAASLFTLPILLTIFDFKEAVGIISIFFVLFSLILVPKNWHQMNKKILITLSISSGIGLIIGVQLLKYMDPFILKKILGIFILLTVIHGYVKKEKI
ncbi:MAG: sulfite exporter TauE/SafE family protein, partial [Candidatus Peregrinibacteria bacterium]